MIQLYGAVGSEQLVFTPSPTMGAVSDSVAQFTDSIGSQLGGFLPGLVGALLLLIVGLIVATVAGAI